MKIIQLLLVYTALFVLLSEPVGSQNLEATVEPNSTNTFEGILFESKESISIKGKRITDDMFALGKTVSLENTVEGDLLIGGGEVEVSGRILGNLRIIGGRVLINSEVLGNTSVLGGEIILGQQAVLHKSLLVGAGNVKVLGKVEGSGLVAAHTTHLDTPIIKTWKVYTDEFILGEAFNNSHGKLTYYSPQKAVMNPNGSELGNVYYVQEAINPLATPLFFNRDGKDLLYTLMAIGGFVEMLLLLALGIALISLVPNLFPAITNTASGQYHRAALIGLLALLITIVIIVLLIITLVGIPLAIIGGLLAVFVQYAARIVGSILIGLLLLKQTKFKENYYGALLCGLLLYYLAGFLPLLGVFYHVYIIALGLGSMYIYVKVNPPVTLKQSQSSS